MFSLKLCCVLTAIVATTNAGLTQQQIETIQTVMNDCKEKTGATDDDLGIMMKHEIPETNSGLCFAACVKKTLGILKADNTLDVVKIEQMLATLKDEEPEKYNDIMKIVKFCATTVEIDADECQTSKKIMHCFKDQIAENQLKIDFMSMISS